MNITSAIEELMSNGLILPYNFLPGTIEGGLVTFQNRAKWDAYQWNPPQFLANIDGYKDLDPNASNKPTWAELVTAFSTAILKSMPIELTIQANREVTRRIAENYHPEAGRDRNKEWEVRLSGIGLTDKDAERVRLIAICHTIEASINVATTIQQLEAIDIESDSVWSADDD